MLIKTSMGEIDVSCQNTKESIDGAKAFIENLVANNRIVEGNGPLPSGATHRIVYEDGVKILRRERFF